MPASRSPRARRRLWWLACGVALVCAALAVGVFLVLGSMFDHWNGWDISITNNCGHDLYADDGRDGVPIEDGQTIRWDGASRSGDKTIRLWSSTSDPVNGVDGLVVELHGDSVLAGSECP